MRLFIKAIKPLSHAALKILVYSLTWAHNVYHRDKYMTKDLFFVL